MHLTNLTPEVCKIRVAYFGAMKGIVKRREETVSLPKESASVRKLLEVLANEYGERFENLTKFSKGSSPLVTIFVNGVVISDVHDSERLLADGSEVEVSLINQMSGG